MSQGVWLSSRNIGLIVAQRSALTAAPPHIKTSRVDNPTVTQVDVKIHQTTLDSAYFREQRSAQAFRASPGLGQNLDCYI